MNNCGKKAEKEVEASTMAFPVVSLHFHPSRSFVIRSGQNTPFMKSQQGKTLSNFNNIITIFAKKPS
jgi:hypothetical protein